MRPGDITGQLLLATILVPALAASPLAVKQAAAEEFAASRSPVASELVKRNMALPSLPELFQHALEHDAELSNQRYMLEASEQEVPIARSQLLPQVSAAGGYLWQDSTNVQTVGDEDLGQPATRPDEFDEMYWRFTIQQPLFSLERWRGLDLADSEVDAARLDLALIERDLALQVSEAYINAYLGSRTLGLLESQQESLELQVRQAQRAYDLGVGDRINLFEAQSRSDQAVADAVQAENDLEDALGELERLTGLMPEFGSSQLGDLTAAVIERDWDNDDAWLAQIENNLDVLRAQAEREIAESNTLIRRSGHYPEVNLNLSYNDRVSDDELRTSEDYTASVELNMPLYRGGYTIASVRQGELRARATQEGVQHARNLAAQEVRKRLRALNGNVRRLGALQQAISSSELYLEAAERGEQLGLRDLVDVLDARASLYDQRIQYVDTLGSFLTDRLALQSAVGRLSSDDLRQVMILLISITET